MELFSTELYHPPATSVCVKTGANIFVAGAGYSSGHPGLWVLTDMYLLDTVYWFRVSNRTHISPVTFRDVVHFAVAEIDGPPWLVDEETTSVLIAHKNNVFDYGDGGAPVAQNTSGLELLR